jgi:hypothetical protein
VLVALLRHEVPEGLDPRSARLTSRVLSGRGRGDAVHPVPDLVEMDDFAGRFDEWARTPPRQTGQVPWWHRAAPSEFPGGGCASFGR